MGTTFSFLQKKNSMKSIHERKEATKRKHVRYMNKEMRRKIATDVLLSTTGSKLNDYRILKYYKEIRTQFLANLIQKRVNQMEIKKFDLLGSYGLEGSDEEIANFIELGQQTIDKNYADLVLDMNNCSRIWPSAITLLCSLLEWTEYNHKKCHCTSKPRISSSSPSDKLVDDYLEHCGFYQYVGRGFRRDIQTKYDSVVRIRRENDRDNQDERMIELFDLVKEYSNLNEEQIERFECYIMPDILLNVTEHGISCNDLGWWVLGQHHTKHQIISICVADNGIGIKNSLLTGPQKKEIQEMFEKSGTDDSFYIELACKESISGAHNASVAEKTIFSDRKYNFGVNRGHGLPLILSNCRDCGIKLSIFSHSSYIVYNSNGEIEKKGTCDSPLFAGTLYNLVIPARTS